MLRLCITIILLVGLIVLYCALWAHARCKCPTSTLLHYVQRAGVFI